MDSKEDGSFVPLVYHFSASLWVLIVYPQHSLVEDYAVIHHVYSVSILDLRCRLITYYEKTTISIFVFYMYVSHS